MEINGFETDDFPVPVAMVEDGPTSGSEKQASPVKINRFHYEVAVLESLREKLRCKLIWIEGAYRYRNPDDDLPSDWETSREARYLQLGLPLKASDFIKSLNASYTLTYKTSMTPFCITRKLKSWIKMTAISK